VTALRLVAVDARAGIEWRAAGRSRCSCGAVLSSWAHFPSELEEVGARTVVHTRDRCLELPRLANPTRQRAARSIGLRVVPTRLRARRTRRASAMPDQRQLRLGGIA